MRDFFRERRGLLSLLAGGAVSGCAGFGKESPFWGTMIAGVAETDAPTRISRAYAEQLPYASMLAWFKNAPQALVVLAEILPDGRHVWQSAERQSITTFGPFITGAIGFDIELRGTSFKGTWAADPLAMVGQRLERILDIAIQDRRHQLLLESTFALGKKERITILDRTYELQKVREKIRSDGRGRYENDYWVELDTRRCWKARQTIVPTLPVFHTEILKYPAV